MRVYLSAAFARREEMRETAAWLRGNGYEVYARWTEFEEPASLSFEEMASLAALDLNDLCSSDMVVTFSDAPDPAGDPGRQCDRHLELGAAVAMQMPVVVVRSREAVLHWMDDLPQVFLIDGGDGWEEKLLGRLEEVNLALLVIKRGASSSPRERPNGHG